MQHPSQKPQPRNRTVAVLPLSYPYAITASPSNFKIVGKEGSYAGQGHLREIRFGGLNEQLQIAIDKEPPSKTRDQIARRPTLAVPSRDLTFVFEDEGYKFYQDPNTREYLSIYGEGGPDRRYRLGSLEDPTSNIRRILDATPTDFARQKEITQKLPKKFMNVGQMTKACYTVLEHFGLVERTGERRSMLLRKTGKSPKEVQEAHR